MKTFSKILFVLVLAMALLAISNSTNAQGPYECDPDVPFLGILPHPDTDPILELEGKVTYTYNATQYIDIHCGQNKYMEVDPCDPWKLEFYVALWEQDSDAVVVIPPVWNWDTTVCQDIRFDYVWPVPYVPGVYTDSVVIKVTMITHDVDAYDILGNEIPCVSGDPLYPCIYGNLVDTSRLCWRDCMNERIQFECQDSCEIPNRALCVIEWDKPLPVELTSFTSTVKDNTVVLNWTTSNEKNNARFVIERMVNGIWTDIGNVAGNGTTSNISNYSFTDKNLNSGIYNYRLRQVDYNGNFEYFNLNGAVAIGVPNSFSLSQNYPNPFNPTTTILYGVPNDGYVTMKVFDNNGREVKTIVNEPKTAGYYTVEFNATGLSSGVYFYKLESGNNVVTKKMVLMK